LRHSLNTMLTFGSTWIPESTGRLGILVPRLLQIAGFALKPPQKNAGGLGPGVVMKVQLLGASCTASILPISEGTLRIR
jgi:hypothetical protein